MNILIVGATGATGRLLVEQLLDRGHGVKAVVRSADRLPESVRRHARLSIIEASVLDLTAADLAAYVKGCDAVVSCLGHNMTLKGIYGQPRRLVTDAVHRLCDAINANAPGKPVKFVLMNTTGNHNPDLDEPISLAQKGVLGLLRMVLPPHVDNEQAARYLSRELGHDGGMIAWVAVRPDGLIDEETVTEYRLFPSPIRSSIFDAGQTSRINVAHFMAELITNDDTWRKWKGQMPVIYNKASAEGR